MFLSAAVYRHFDLNEARPLLITILAALTMTAGLAFLYDALRRRWSQKVALAAGWFYALYPEGILLGSSQMREPFLIGLFGIAFWALVTWREKLRLKALVFAFAVTLSIVISAPFGAILAGVLIAFWFVEWLTAQTSRRIRRAGLLALVAAGAAGVYAGWLWLKPTLYYDAYLTRISSGNITALLEINGRKVADAVHHNLRHRSAFSAGCTDRSLAAVLAHNRYHPRIGLVVCAAIPALWILRFMEGAPEIRPLGAAGDSSYTVRVDLDLLAARRRRPVG